jgi:hypothetical protein
MSKNTRDTLASSAPVTADPFLTDPHYREAARQALSTYLDTCVETLQQAGVTPPELPTLDDKTVSGLAAQMLWLNKWIISFDPGSMKPQLSPVPLNAFILTKDQIQKNIEEILPGYRLIEKPVYDQWIAKHNARFLQVDFNHRILYGHNHEVELIHTLRSYREQLAGIFGALIHLLKTSEEHKLGASVAECFNQALITLGSLLAACAKTEAMDSDTFDRIYTSINELHQANGVLLEVLADSETNQFGLSLSQTTDETLRDIWALMDAYTQQTESAEVVDEAGGA